MCVYIWRLGDNFWHHCLDVILQVSSFGSWDGVSYWPSTPQLDYSGLTGCLWLPPLKWHFKLKPWPVFLFLFLTRILGPNSGASAYTSGSLSAKPSSPSPDDHEESHESCHEITRSSIGTTIQRIFDSLPSFSSSDLYKYPIPTMRLFRLVCPP